MRYNATLLPNNKRCCRTEENNRGKSYHCLFTVPPVSDSSSPSLHLRLFISVCSSLSLHLCLFISVSSSLLLSLHTCLNLISSSVYRSASFCLAIIICLFISVSSQKKIQKNAVYWDKTNPANCRSSPVCQATKRYLNNS